MRLEIQLGGVNKSVEIDSTQGKLQFLVDGRVVEADVIRIASRIYSILLDGQSFEVGLESRGPHIVATLNGKEFTAEIRDPRRLKQARGGGVEAEGKQSILAPMPGKVVRVLASVGEAVESNGGLVVIEAMKMQNEVRSPKSGVVERMLVVEGQAVSSGDVLAVIA